MERFLFKFTLRPPAELDDLPQELARVLEENRRQVAKRGIQVLGTYDSMEQAVEAARFLVQKYQPTPQAGWLNVHAVAIPQIGDVPVFNRKASQVCAYRAWGARIQFLAADDFQPGALDYFRSIRRAPFWPLCPGGLTT